MVSAGSIKLCLINWKRLTMDKSILGFVTGYYIDFISPPLQSREPTRLMFTEVECNFVQQEIARLTDLCAITQSVTEPGQFISSIFLRPKRNGSFRLILNLKILNTFVEYHHFKMDTLSECINIMTPNCFMASLDLRDAYYSVPIAKACQKFLKFRFGGQLYQFTCLPNGLSSGPRVFTKLMKPVLAKLRQDGHFCCGYLDDLYLQGPDELSCLKTIEASRNLLSDLGFHINFDKSVFQPSQKLEHLGFVLCSKSMTVSLGNGKIEQLKEMGRNLLSVSYHSIRSVAQYIGTLVACFPGVEYGPLYFRRLERAKSVALKLNYGNFNASMSLSPGAIEEIIWWTDNAAKFPKTISRNNPTLVLQTDASTSGWGAHLIGGASTGGRWTDTEATDHINVLELKAAFFGLKVLCGSAYDVHVQVQLDNRTAVAYIREMGGSRSVACNSLAYDIWQWCIARCMWLSSTHIPGVDNVEADKESRLFDDKTEWQLNRTAFDYCRELWGQPDIDLFASRLNHQFKPYISWHPDPEAHAVDAFSISWRNSFVYAFPPFRLISRVLKKIKEDEATAILIAPDWSTQPWFSVLRSLKTAEPLLLPNSKTLLTLPGQPSRIHPLYPKLRLKAYLLCAKDFTDKE